MMDPNSGVMTPVDMKTLYAEFKEDKAKIAGALKERFPGQVLWTEGEEIEVRGCRFRVDAVRRTRVTLTPIARTA